MPDLELPRKKNMNLGKPKMSEHDCSAAAAVVERGLGAVEESVAPVDQTAPSNRYLPKCPSQFEEVHIQDIRNMRETMADIGFVGHKQKTYVVHPASHSLRGGTLHWLGKRALNWRLRFQSVRAEPAHSQIACEVEAPRAHH